MSYLKGKEVFSWLSPSESREIVEKDLSPVENWRGKKKIESISKSSSQAGKEIDLRGIYYQPENEDTTVGFVDDMNRICVICKEYILSNQGYCRVKDNKTYICRSCRNRNLRCVVHPDIGKEVIEKDGTIKEFYRQCTNCILTKLYLIGKLE